VADFPVEADADPAGKELAAHVQSILTAAGFSSSSPDEREGWAWEFTTKHDAMTIDSIVGLVDDFESKPPRQWLVTNNCKLPLLKRICGGAGAAAKRDSILKGFCTAIHAAISADSRFSDIVWYNAKTFDKLNDEPGESP